MLGVENKKIVDITQQWFALGGIQKLRGQDEGGGSQKMSVFVHAQGLKLSMQGGGWGQKMAKFCPRSS